MSMLGAVWVFCGAGLGALLRWWLGGQLNPLHATIPLGTVAANLVGGLLVGVASAGFGHHTEIPVEWRLLVITGFLGGLTTFSTFSLEVVTLLQRQDYAWAAATAGVHLVGSLALTALGFVIAQALFVRA
jgi:fluoride exporter